MDQKATADRILKQLVEDRGWQSGTSLENRVAFHLSRFSVKPTDLMQQYRVGRYRLDFAAPDVQMAIEADGWHHRSPDQAAKDVVRDCELRRRGWIIFRVDDTSGEESLREQICRAIRLIRFEWEHNWGRMEPNLRSKKRLWGTDPEDDQPDA